MPELILNTVPSDTRKQNQVIYLEQLSKAQILRELLNLATYPDTTVLALAEEIPDPDPTRARDMWTTSEFLEKKGVTLDRSQKHKFANKVTKYYKEAHQGMSPRVISRPDDRGRWLLKLNGYEYSDLPILERALEETLESSPRNRKK